VARLRPGVTVAQARDDLQRIAAQLEKAYPDTNTQMGVGLSSLQEWLIGDVRTALVLFMASAGLVLLIACANLANLLLVRASGRGRELAVRSALGASGWRIARQMVTENLLLAGIGGSCSVVIARWTLDTLVNASPVNLPRLDEVALDWPVLAFVVGTTAVTALLIGVLPAWTGARASAAALRDGARTTGAGGAVRRALVISQVAASVALVVCAGLLLRSFERLQSVPPGFDPEGVVTFQLTLPGATYADEGKVIQFWEALLSSVRTLPGVQSAGASTVLGLEGRGWTGDLFIDGRPGFQGRQLGHKDVTPGYFAAMGLRILRGRDVADTDTTAAPAAVVVNDAYVQAYFPGEDPLGRRISYSRSAPSEAWRTIVGVVSNEKQDGLAAAVHPQVYESHRQNPTTGMTVVVRAAAPEAALVPSLRQQVRAIDPGLAIYGVRTLRDVVATSVARERFTAGLVALFAGLALAIAAIGVYGVIAASVSRRTREIGVRVALGADRRGVLWLVTRETLALVGAGMAAGFGAAAAAASAIRGMLFQISPADPLTYALVVAILGVVALAATYLPARRALAVDPMAALRCE
jgi:predicted permease